MHKKPVIVKNLRKVKPTKDYIIFCNLIKNSTAFHSRKITLHKDGITSIETYMGTAYKELKKCWTYHKPKALYY
jgi:hypothetical protein